MQIILASNSPRRSALLKTLGLDFSVVAGAELDEKHLLQILPGPLEQKLEQLAVLKGSEAALAYPESIVLSADTEVILDGRCLGKPADPANAREMLARLSGREHHVFTAVAVQRARDGLELTGHEITAVEFNSLDENSIARYVELDQPMDKAGGYAIQGLGALLVKGIVGDYPNVVGLPLGLTARMLGQAGIQLL